MPSVTRQRDKPLTFVSTTGYSSGRSLPSILAAFAKAGISAVELGTSHPPEKDMETLLRSFDFDYSVHNYFPLTDPELVLNLASANDDVRSATLTAAKLAIDIGVAVGAHFYGIHAGFLSDVKSESLGKPLQYETLAERSTGFSNMLESAAELCEYANGYDMPVYFENHVLAAFNLSSDGRSPLLLVDANEAVDFFEQLDQPNAGLLVDVGHLNVSATTLEFDRGEYVDTVRPWIKALHLSDNDGLSDETKAYDENAWFSTVVSGLQNVDCVIESEFESTAEAKQMSAYVEGWRSQSQQLSHRESVQKR